MMNYFGTYYVLMQIVHFYGWKWSTFMDTGSPFLIAHFDADISKHVNGFIYLHSPIVIIMYCHQYMACDH